MILAISAFSSTIYAQKEIAIDGVSLPRKITFQNRSLELNGAGTREKMWMELYIQALYLTQLSQDPQAIINGQSEMAIRMHITSPLISSSKLTKALHKAFEKSVGDKINSFLPKMDLLLSMLNEQIKENDVFDLIYTPTDNSVWVYKNLALKGKVEGLEFKKALFGIWLSDNPIDKDLKNDLLGI